MFCKNTTEVTKVFEHQQKEETYRVSGWDRFDTVWKHVKWQKNSSYWVLLFNMC